MFERYNANKRMSQIVTFSTTGTMAMLTGQIAESLVVYPIIRAGCVRGSPAFDGQLNILSIKCPQTNHLNATIRSGCLANAD